jgi:hypothetical protein
MYLYESLKWLVMRTAVLSQMEALGFKGEEAKIAGRIFSKLSLYNRDRLREELAWGVRLFKALESSKAHPNQTCELIALRIALAQSPDDRSLQNQLNALAMVIIRKKGAPPKETGRDFQWLGAQLLAWGKAVGSSLLHSSPKTEDHENYRMF